MSDRLLISLIALAFIIAAIPIALGFMLGAAVWGFVVAWQFAKRVMLPPPTKRLEEDD